MGAVKLPEHMAVTSNLRCDVCHELASRLIKCLRCKAVIARCSVHGQDMMAERKKHCP